MKRLLAAALLLIGTVTTAWSQAAPAPYDMIATAYVTTTISQIVVLDSAQQAAGNLTFSIQAHNGGGRPGQADTAKVQLQFYNSSNSLLYTANSQTYSLPLPNGVGQPGIDPTVPWTTMTVSSANCGGSCANVAYVKVIASGTDGSYWAGDYGPWYMAPSLTVNGGANILYNPEFGPYNNVSAHGWSISPALGACQGAWGGSNPCIANSSGQAGQNTTGLIANANGGGPVATGGTTAAPAGGTAQSAPKPPAPNFTQLKFSAAQVADSQWDVYACTQTNTCQIYSTNPGTAYQIPWTSGQWNWQSGQYIQFSATGDANNPYEAKVYNSDGTLAGTLGTGHIVSMGTDSSGHALFFFVGNDNDTGQLFSTNYGFSGNGGYTWTGTLNPTTAQVDTFAGSGSTTPLAAGQTGGTATAPTVTSTTITNTTSITNSYPASWTDSVPTINIGPGPGQSIITSTDTTLITSQPVITTTTTTPTITTNYSDGTSKTSTGTPTSTTSTSTTYSSSLQVNPRPYITNYGLANQVYMDQIGSNNTVDVTQTGRDNNIAGVNQPNAQVRGNSNSVTVTQGGSGGLPNSVDLFVQGTGNTVRLVQGINANDTSTSGQYNSTSITGNNNQVISKQSNDGGLGMHYSATTVTGDSNTVNTGQYNNGGKSMTTTINGNNNTLNASQTGTGQHSLSTTMTGYGNSATVSQSGSYAASASITLNNAGGSSSATVIQNANSAPTAYSIYQSCSNPAGCGVSITQNK
jgi:hypothetical protein